MLAVTVACLVMAGVRSIEPPAEPSFFDQLGIKYVGLNGMEDYLVAADLANRQSSKHLVDYFSILPLKKSAPQAYANWLAQNGYPEGVNAQSTFLDVCNVVAARFEPMQKAIADGNRKPLTSLRRGPVTLNTTFPELAGYRQASKMGFYAIYSDLAKGNSHLAVAKVEDLVAFGERVAQDTLIEALVGLAVEAVGINAIELHMDRFSVPDLKRLRTISKTWTTGTMSIEKAIQAELQLQLSLYGEAKDLKSLDVFFDQGEVATWPDEFRAAVDKYPFETVKPAFQKAIQDLVAEVQAAMARPESERESALRLTEMGAKLPSPPQSLDELAHMLVRYTGPQFTQIHSAGMRRRTQLRLLGLHTYVLEYRWNWDRLPEKLEDCAPKELLADPYSGRPFVYKKLSEREYELYSEGTEVSGRINLSRQSPRETGPSGEGP